MVRKYLIATQKVLNSLIQIQERQNARLKELEEYGGLNLKVDGISAGRAYYSVSKTNASRGTRKYKYLGKEPNDTVRRVKEVKHLEKALKILGKNIYVLEKVIAEVKPVDRDSVDQMLPAVYRKAVLAAPAQKDPRAVHWKKQAEAYKATFEPYHPEELIHPTDDGTMVRSKSEALIYNFLLRLGITFVYELPVKTRTRTRFPDFTLLSEVDYKTVILIEHQGMMNEPEYRDRFRDRVYDYLKANYISGINIYYTFDSIDGSVNMMPILDIIKLKIRPEQPSGVGE